jgi:chromosomal replication initiator protein
VTELAAQHWQAVLEKLSSQVGQQSYDTWFSRMEVLRFDADEVELGVANRFIREWVSDHYLAVIREAISDVTGSVPDVRFTISGKAFREMRRMQEEDLPPAPAPAPRAGTTPALNPEFTLEEYVVGPSNRLAHVACVGVVENPASVYNPLFVYGGSGLGKTHLLQAVCRATLAKRPGANVVYVSCEEFVNGYISSVQAHRIDEFRARYRQVDTLVVDDIHFLTAKSKSQDEFLYTFDALHNLGKQVVLSSDAHVKEIASLQSKLVTRFVSGLVARIQPPDFETRVAILRHKARKRGLKLTDEMFDEIARQVDRNVRELEGALKKITALASLDGGDPSPALVRLALREVTTSREGPVSLKEIAKAVQAEFGVSIPDLRSRKRTRNILRPRQIAMFVAKHVTEHSLAEIGAFFGGRDHATVVHSAKRVRAELAKDETYRRGVENAFRALGRPMPPEALA